MYFSRNIIFITCLLSGICYSQNLAPHRVPGGSFFLTPGTRLVNPTPGIGDITKKFAEELLCGDSTGWAANFVNTRGSTRSPLRNPCGMGKCRVNTLMTDFDCECFEGYKFNANYGGLGNLANPRTCVKSKSLVTCKPGSQRVAAEQLIVGQVDIVSPPVLFPWVGGVYERVAGTGYQNTNDESYNPVTNILQRGPPHPMESHIQQYRHNVPLKGREYYEKYEVDQTSDPLTACDIVMETRPGMTKATRKVIATLSYNYEENQWQFNSTEINAGGTLKYPDENLKVYARSTKKCVEDVTSWTYTYLNSGGRHNVGTVFIKKLKNPIDANLFQIRDKEALIKVDNATPSTLSVIRGLIYPSPPYPHSSLTAGCPADSYLEKVFQV